MNNGVEVIVKDVVKIYEAGVVKINALKGVSLQVKSGEIVSIMGPSGSGKTTLLNIIGGVDKPTSGEVIVNGENIVGYSEARLRRYRLHVVGYIFQFFNLVSTLNALENIVLPIALAGKSYDYAVDRAYKLLDMVGLRERWKHLPSELSGGERQRLAIAVALANDPPLILADEPTGELDMVNAENVMNILAKLAREKNKTIIVSTHDPRIARLTDRIYLLEDGLVKGVYKPEKIGVSLEAFEEASREKIIGDYLRNRLTKIDEEIKQLIDSFRSNNVGLNEFVEKYIKLKYLREAYLDELGRLGLPTSS